MLRKNSGESKNQPPNNSCATTPAARDDPLTFICMVNAGQGFGALRRTITPLASIRRSAQVELLAGQR
jgi:hypothetical protein